MGLREIRATAVAIMIAPYIRGNKSVVFLLSEHRVSCTLTINEKGKNKNPKRSSRSCWEPREGCILTSTACTVSGTLPSKVVNISRESNLREAFFLLMLLFSCRLRSQAALGTETARRFSPPYWFLSIKDLLISFN